MLWQLGTLRDDPRLFMLYLAALVVSLLIGISFHEFSHAFVADALGDPTPRNQGRVTLNPARHFDPMGTVMMVLGGFGWGRPVMFNPYKLRINPSAGIVLTKLAGPASNFLVAAALGAPLRARIVPFEDPAFLSSWSAENYLAFFLFYIVVLNITLGVFNLLPFPPLDGGGIAVILPGPVGDFFRKMEQGGWSIGILFLLLFLPRLTGGAIDPVGGIINPIRIRLLELFLAGR